MPRLPDLARPIDVGLPRHMLPVKNLLAYPGIDDATPCALSRVLAVKMLSASWDALTLPRGSDIEKGMRFRIYLCSRRWGYVGDGVDCNVLPVNLPKLSFRDLFDEQIDDVRWPASLLSLLLGQHSNRSIAGET